MKTRNRLLVILAWFQLVVSLLLATAIIWGYITFHVLTGQFVISLAASVDAVAAVVVRTAETVEDRQEMLVAMHKSLGDTRNLITQLRATADYPMKLAPEIASGIKTTSGAIGGIVGPIQTIGQKLTEISIPDIQIVGAKPVITMTKPFETQGKQIKETGEKIKATEKMLADLSVSIGRDAQQVSAAFVATSNQAIKVIDETEKTLARLKTQDLPKAISDLKATSENLRSISSQVGALPNIGLFALAAGLLLSLWCVAHSLGSLLLARSHTFDQVAGEVN